MKSFGRQAAGAMAWNFAGKMYFTLVKYAESILLVRMLGAEEYGALGTVLNLQAMTVMAVGLGLNNAILRFLPQVRESGADERSFLARVAGLRLVLTLAGAAVLALAAGPLAEHFIHDPHRTPLIWAAALMAIATSLQNLLTRVMVSRFQQRSLNLIQSAVATLYLALAAGVLYFDGGVEGVLFANVATAALGTALIYWRTERRPSINRGQSPISTDSRGSEIGDCPRFKGAAGEPKLKRLVGYSFTFYLYDLLNFVLDKSLDILLLGLLHPDLRQVAWYLLAYNFAFNSYAVFTKVFAEGFTLGVVSEVWASGDRERLHKVFGGLVEYMYLFIIPVMAGGAILMPDLIRVMYGTEGLGAIGPAALFLVVMGLGKYQGVTANFLGAMDRERSLIVSRAIFAVLNLGLDLALIPRYGAWGATIATSIATITGLVYESVLLHRALGPRYPWSFFAKTAGSALVMAAAVAALCRVLPDSAGLRVGAGLVVGVVVYVAGLFVTKPISPYLLETAGQMRVPGLARLARALTPKGYSA